MPSLLQAPQLRTVPFIGELLIAWEFAYDSTYTYEGSDPENPLDPPGSETISIAASGTITIPGSSAAFYASGTFNPNNRLLGLPNGEGRTVFFSGDNTPNSIGDFLVAGTADAGSAASITFDQSSGGEAESVFAGTSLDDLVAQNLEMAIHLDKLVLTLSLEGTVYGTLTPAPGDPAESSSLPFNLWGEHDFELALTAGPFGEFTASDEADLFRNPHAPSTATGSKSITLTVTVSPWGV